MKFFAVLAVCLTVANARPDVSGYAYPKPPAGFNNENYIAQPPVTTYSTGASNTQQFLTVPSKTSFTTVTRGDGFDSGFNGGNTFSSGGGSNTFSSGGGGNSFSSGVIGGSGPAFETVKTVTTTRTDGGNFGSVGGLDSGVNRFTTGGGSSGGQLTDYKTINSQTQGFGIGSGGSIGSGSLGGQRVTTNEYTTSNQGQGSSFGTGGLTSNEYTTVQGGSQGFGLGGSTFTTGSGSSGLDGRFGQETITNLGHVNPSYNSERTRYVNVQTEYVTRAPIVTKNFYVHAAPEDDEEIVSRQRIHVPAPQKNYKIIFIKAPQPLGYNAAAIPPPVQNEEKTIVYVLVKKPEGTNQEIEIPAPPPTKPTKPEVYFIKYKGKDATQTIQTIQNQYANQGVIAGKDYSSSGVTSGFVPGGSSTTFSNTKTAGRFSGDDGVQFTGTGGTGSTSYTTKTVTSGGNDGGVQFVASAPIGGSAYTTKTVTTQGGNGGGVQFVAPSGGSSYTTKTVTSGGDGGAQFVTSAPVGLSYSTNTVSGGDLSGQYVASLPTGGSSFTTKTVTTSGGGSGFETPLRFGGESLVGDSGSTYTVNTGPVSSYTTKTITSEQTGGGNSGYNVLRFGGTEGIEGGSSGTTYTASAPSTSYTTSTKTVQVPSLTYETISGSTGGSFGHDGSDISAHLL